MASSQSHEDPPEIATAFNVRTAIELSQRSIFDRVGFSAVYALLSIAVLPWLDAVGWIAAIVVWEWAVSPQFDRAIARLPEHRAATPYAAVNLFASVIYQALAFVCLENGSALGVAMGTTWVCGAVLNAFVYSSANRRLLLATLLPTAAASIIGPMLAYGPGWKAAIIPSLLGLASLASRRFSLDYGALLSQLTDRQIEFADVERKLSIAIEASGDGLFELDLLTDEIQVSPNWLAMLGYVPGELEATIPNWRPFVHPDDVPVLEHDYVAHFRGETPNTTSELRMRCNGGEHKWVLSRARLVSRTEDGQPWRVVGTIIDLSVRKALEHQLETARDLAESANRAKSEFLANMSHEIRTPLNGVMGVAGALRHTRLDARQAEMVSVIEDSAESLQVLLADILDLARVEAGRLEISPQSFDPREAVVNIAELFRAKAEEKGLQLNVQVSAGLDPCLQGDKVRIKQILGNLLSNAVKFTTEGSVGVTVSAEPMADSRRQVRFEVKDTGIGFDSAVRERLFSRFSQADGSITRRFGGTGLGLSISNALAELMEGSITVESRPGEGSTFVLNLPLSVAELPTGEIANPNAAAERRLDEDSPLRILAAEDHEVNRRVLQLIFEGLSVDMTIAENGREAVDRFADARFDLILMDMQMPVMDGLQAITEIRTREQYADLERTPIIMLTANALPEHEAAGRAAGADAFVTKPISAQSLLATIEETLAEMAQTSAA